MPELARQPRPEIAWRRFEEPLLARHIEAVHRRDGRRVPAVAALLEALTDEARDLEARQEDRARSLRGRTT